MSLTHACVLLVEDNAELASNVIEILEDEGCSVVHASTGAAARDAARAGFDVALVDVNLPDSTGLELLRELKGLGDPAREILLVTGNATTQDAIEAVKGGAYDYIIKPFHGRDLVASVERAVRQVRASREARALGQEVADREQKLRTWIETVQALLLVLDDRCRIVQANPAVAEATGLGRDELIGLPWIETFVVPGQDRAAAWQVFERLVAGEARVTHEHRVRSAAGQGERVISWQSSALAQPDGTMLVYASGLDVTELKDLENRTHLAERLAAVGTMAAGLAHEIRNPLNSAHLQLHLLDRRIRKSGSDANLLEPIHMVQQEIERLSHLVQEFLDFARPSVLHLEHADLIELLAHLIELERPAATEQAIAIHLRHAGEPVIVNADKAKVQQIMLNLLRNAIEAIGRDGDIVVNIEMRGSDGVVVIHDTGPGLSEEARVRIFEPFFSTKSNGTGLGMAICHSLVTQHGGTIRIKSDDAGATFEVVFPRNPPVSPQR